MNDDLHAWSGLYAADALEGEERERFERHLDECEDCRIEVAGFHDATAQLAAAGATEPPPPLRAGVLSATATTRQEPPVVTSLAPRRTGAGRHPSRWGL